MKNPLHAFSDTQHLEDKSDIIDTIFRFFHAMDMHNWTLLRDCLADQIDTDYADLRGETRRIVSADDFVEKRIEGLSNLRTQHISTNHLVDINGEQAECNSCFLIHRLDPSQPEEENTFDTAGHYTHGLIHTGSGWRIDRIRQAVLWNRGRREVHGAFRRH